MKQWFRLTLVCGVLVGLLLGLTQVVGLNYLLPVVASGQCFDRGTEPVSDASTVSFIRSMEFHLARAGPLESLVFDCALTCRQHWSTRSRDLWATETDRALEGCRSSRQLKSTPSRPFLRKITGPTDRI
jgi:hypothetical protein